VSDATNVARWYARLGGALRATSLVVRQRLRLPQGYALASRWVNNPKIQQYRWQLAIGAGLSVLSGALAVILTRDPPPLSPTQVPDVEWVSSVEPAWDGATQEQVTVLLRPKVAELAAEAPPPEELLETPPRKRPAGRRSAATTRKAGPNTRLKNPFN
jgi:hypothetical protein